MEERQCDHWRTVSRYLISAFLAMEPIHHLISLARVCGGGTISEDVQKFIWEQCINTVDNENRPSDLYTRNFLKKVIVSVESSGHVVLDELYEKYTSYITSVQDSTSVRSSTWVCKHISFLLPDASADLSGQRISLNGTYLVVPLLCSTNMLEGDTGCSIWPSSLLLSEFILSYPDIFAHRSCFEIGSGVGLLGICLACVKAYQVVLTDGDLSTLANMKLNLQLNKLHVSDKVECMHLPWESATNSGLQDIHPDVILAADVIYDSSCLLHLVRILAILLKPKHSNTFTEHGNSVSNRHINDDHEDFRSEPNNDEPTKQGPVAYIATVIRNAETFDCFMRLALQAQLSVVDITETKRPLNFLPYMISNQRSSVRLFIVSLGK